MHLRLRITNKHDYTQTKALFHPPVIYFTKYTLVYRASASFSPTINESKNNTIKTKEDISATSKPIRYYVCVMCVNRRSVINISSVGTILNVTEQSIVSIDGGTASA